MITNIHLCENKATFQAIFNKSALHLLEQNKKSFSDTGECAYKDPDGLSCAIGCFMKDEHYDSTCEGSAVNTDLVGDILKLSEPDLFKGPPFNIFLTSLQLIHDSIEVDHWYEQLKELAGRYELSTDRIDEYKLSEIMLQDFMDLKSGENTVEPEETFSKYKAIRFKGTKDFAVIYGRELYASELPTLLTNIWDMQSYIEHQFEHDAVSVLLMTRLSNECEMVDLKITSTLTN